MSGKGVPGEHTQEGVDASQDVPPPGAGNTSGGASSGSGAGPGKGNSATWWALGVPENMLTQPISLAAQGGGNQPAAQARRDGPGSDESDDELDDSDPSTWPENLGIRVHYRRPDESSSGEESEADPEDEDDISLGQLADAAADAAASRGRSAGLSLAPQLYTASPDCSTARRHVSASGSGSYAPFARQ